MTRRRAIVVLIVFVVIVAGGARVLTGSGDHEGTAIATVGQLWRNASQYEGERVQTSGAVRIFSPGPNEYFVIEQAGQYRMGLRGLSNADWEPLAGQTVTVEGVVRFKEGFGYYIEVEHVEPAATGTPASS